MPYMIYRGYEIQVMWKADRRYAVQLLPHDHPNATANRDIEAGKDAHQLSTPDGGERYFPSVTAGMRAATQHIDGLREAGYPR